ncbi:hypothetical protein B4092_4617 [Bacillus licheniformis]|nr:hypothetical protein B4092_4617 [Bacillus licheniformis]OLF99064.1 hypothetical protein B4089_0199 [Bacillus licheniformis]TWJ44609.1 hypothetical protein CHCC5025_2177 [Bacillus licheniformis]TWJ91780.1 hypothetical protein CHCC20496_4448 [Bacillus licheniformis]
MAVYVLYQSTLHVIIKKTLSRNRNRFLIHYNVYEAKVKKIVQRKTFGN